MGAGGRTDGLDEGFRNFANASKNRFYCKKMDSKVLCKAKYASVTTKGVGQVYSR
jgi:hypothetical protein